MVYYYKLVARKNPDERKKEVELEGDLEPSPDWVQFDKWSSHKKLWKASSAQLKNYSAQRLAGLTYYDLNRDYEYSEKEELMFWVYNANFNSNPFGKHEVKIPRRLRVKPSKRFDH